MQIIVHRIGRWPLTICGRTHSYNIETDPLVAVFSGHGDHHRYYQDEKMIPKQALFCSRCHDMSIDEFFSEEENKEESKDEK